jgi:hypothetical protein
LSLLCWRKRYRWRKRCGWYWNEITEFTEGDVFIMEERNITCVLGSGWIVVVIIAFISKSKVVTDLVLKVVVGEGNTWTSLEKKYIVFKEGLPFLLGQKFDLLNDGIVQREDGPLVTSDLATSVEAKKVKIPFGISSGGQSNGASGPRKHGVSGLIVIKNLYISTNNPSI